MGRRGEAKRIKPGSKPTKITLYTEDVGSSERDEAPVRPRRAEPKRIKPGSKPTKLTLYSEDAEDADHRGGARHEAPARSPNAGVGGELPLYGASPKLNRSGRVGRRIRRIDATSPELEGKPGGGGGRNDVSADVHLGGHVDSGWPLQNQEIATWASSFRFELDSGRLQAMLEREAQSSGTPGASFRFRNGPEEVAKSPIAPSSKLRPGLVTASRKERGVGDAGIPRQARENVAVDVPNSPERSVILQRLRESKTQAVASPRFGLDDDDDASYHKELAKLTVGRGDGLDQWLKASSPLRRSSIVQSGSADPVEREQEPREIVTAIVLARRKPPKRREGARRAAPQLSPLTPTDSRFKSNAGITTNSNNGKEAATNSASSGTSSGGGSSLQEQILSITKQSLHVVSPSPDRTHFLPAPVPFLWEDQRGSPKAMRLSRGHGIGDGDGARAESHRYYGRVRHSREPSLGQSSRRYSAHETAEAHIDLDASAAAKFLVEQDDTPLGTPGRQRSSPEVAVPFEWEDAPGKAKAGTPPTRASLLQLPPRLAAAPSCRSPDSFGRDLRAAHPFVGFFAPCLTASSPGQGQGQGQQPPQRDRKQSGLLEPSKSLPPRAPSPPGRRRRSGLVGRCSSLPQQGCQISVPRSTTNPAGTDSAWNANPNSNPNAPSSPTSTLHGPDGSSTRTSASNLAFSSCDLDDCARKTSKSSSCASSAEDFTDLPKSSGALAPKTDPQSSRLPGASHPTSRNAPTGAGAPTTSRAACEPAPRGEISRASPERPTRLPYTMPSVAEQMLVASWREPTRRQLLQGLSPRLMRQCSGRRLTRSCKAPPATEAACPSPAYAAALELLSPAMAQRRKARSPARATLVAKPRRRPRFMLSIVRTLKRVVLGRRRRCKPSAEPKLMMYCDALAPPTFQFSKGSS